jgi:hypothetical protein
MANTIDFNVGTNATQVLNQTADAAKNAAKGFTSAKAELRALTQQLLQMDSSSEEFKKASARAAELKDNIGDLSAEINANAGNAFEGISNNVGLFGSRLMDLDLKGAGQALSGMGAAVSRIDFKTLKDEVGGLAKGLKDLGLAVVSNPFFLAVGVLAAIAYNFEEISKWATQASLSEQALAEATTDLNKATEQELLKGAEKITQIEVLTNRVKDNNLTEKERRQALKDLETMYPAYFSNLNGDINDTEALNAAKEKLIANIKSEAKANAAKSLLEAEYAKKLALETEINSKKGQFSQEQLNEALQDARDNQQTFFKEANQNLSDWANGTEGIGKAQLDLEQSMTRIAYLEQEATAAVLANVQTEVKAIHEKTKAANSAAESEREKKKAEREKEKNDYEKSQQEISDIFEKWEEEADQAEIERRKKLDAEMMAEDDRMASIGIQDLIERQKKKEEALLVTQMQINANLTSLQAEQSQKEIEQLRQAEDAKAQLRVNAMKTSLSIISDLAEAFAGDSERQQRKAFQIQKGVSIATATIDTYLAAQGAYASQMSIKTPDAPVRAAVAAGIAIAQGLARVAVISKQQFQGGGTSGASGGGGSVPSANGGTTAPSPANFAFLQNQPQQQAPLQAYVVSTQVSSNLEAQQLINNQARLGG